jgi:hypothetical protein
MPKRVHIDWGALDPILREMAASGMHLAAIARRLQIDDRAVSAHAKRIGVVIRKGEGRRFGAEKPREATVDHERGARRIPSLAELCPLKSLGKC